MSHGSSTLTIRLMGGLGNQLFQYAFGRRLALVNGAALYLDASGYRTSPGFDPAMGLRTCELQEFNIVGTIIRPRADTTSRRRNLARLWRKGWRVLAAVADRLKPYYARQEIVEPADNYARFDPRVLERAIRGSISVRGFWQSEKYFVDIEPQLRRELTLRCSLDSTNERLAADIRSSVSVGIHVRHGDNASLVAPALGVLTVDYYDRALQALSARLKEPNFFVFSDNIPWAKRILGNMVPARYVEHNGASRSHVDLWLMSLCKYHVLANSTFGWWAAWLGRNPEQIVYAPQRYYQNVDRPNLDLYPASWRLI